MVKITITLLLNLWVLALFEVRILLDRESLTSGRSNSINI